MNNLINILARPAAVHLLVWAVISFYWFIRQFALSGLSGDEAEQVLFAQSFQWGYDVANPPLYTWILMGLFSLFGKSVGLVLALKLVILGALYSALYQAARMSLGPRRTLDAALVGLSPLLMFFVSWHSIFVFSHSLLNGLFVILTYMAALKVFKAGQWRWYIVLGFMIGLGLLTKYSYAMFVLGLVGASLTISDVRRHILSPRMLVVLFIAALVLIPHGQWLYHSLAQVQVITAYKLQITDDISYLEGIGKGLWNIVRALFAFMSPFWVLVLLIFPKTLKPAQASDEQPLASILLGRTFAIVLGLMVAMVVFGGITQFRPNYLFLFIMVPLWVFARLPGELIAGKRRKIYAGLVMSAALLSVAGLAGKSIYDPLRCRKCQYLVPYEEIARELERRGFVGGTVFASMYPAPLPGNLAIFLDNARAVSLKMFRTIRPPLQSETGQCLGVWMAPEIGGPITKDMISEMERNFGMRIDHTTTPTRMEFPYYRMPNKKVIIDYILLDPGSGSCR